MNQEEQIDALDVSSRDIKRLAEMGHALELGSTVSEEAIQRGRVRAAIALCNVARTLDIIYADVETKRYPRREAWPALVLSGFISARELSAIAESLDADVRAMRNMAAVDPALNTPF